MWVAVNIYSHTDKTKLRVHIVTARSNVLLERRSQGKDRLAMNLVPDRCCKRAQSQMRAMLSIRRAKHTSNLPRILRYVITL